MRLSDFLANSPLTDRQFAEKIGVTRQALHRYRAGERVPRPEVMNRIVSATDGAVTANDFMAPAAIHVGEPSEAAA